MKKSVVYLSRLIGCVTAGLLLFTHLDTLAAEPSTEVHDRNVDQVALHSQEAAIQKLNGLLKKYKNSSQEAPLLMRLSEVYQQSANIQFRIAHGKSNQNKGKTPLEKYKSFLKLSVNILDRLIKVYSDFDSIDQCYFMRGRAHEDLDEKALAKQDYLHLVKTFPTSIRTIPAYMALAQMAIDNNNHPEAITYLDEVEKSPDSPYFPFALYKLAWSHYNLKNIPRALGFIERHVRFYDDIKKKEETLSSSDAAVRENSLMDSVVFYMDGYEQGLSQYSKESALKYFRNLEDGPHLGRMTLRFAKILRSHQRGDDLLFWKSELIKKEPSRPETIDVVMTIFDYYMNNSKFEEMTPISKDIVALYQSNNEQVRASESYSQARKTLIETASKLQELTLKNKNATQAPTLMKTLSAVYMAFIQVVPEEDPRVSQAHYNLAETLFVIRDYEQATEHYRWVLSHWNKKNGMTYSDIELKAIASRYETLRNSQIIPSNLSATRLDHKTEKDGLRNLPKPLLEWVGWIDSFSGSTPQAKKDLESFQFEANRSIYKHGSTQVATDRLIRFAMNTPDSKYAVPSATLGLDSYIVSEEWKEGYEISKKLLSKKWTVPEFPKHLTEIAENSSYKLLENKFQSKKFEEAIQSAESLLKEFPSGARKGDCLILMAQASLSLNKKENAEKYFSRLIQEFPNSKDKDTALLARAHLSEESYRYSQAVRDYETYLSAKTDAKPSDRDLEIQKRIYFLKWVSGETPTVCKNQRFDDDETDLNIECQRYQALSHLKNEDRQPEIDEDQAKKFVKLALKGVKENRPIWAAVALKYSSDLEFRDRLVMVRVLSNGWEKLDPLVRFSLVPSMTKLIPEIFTLTRTELKKVVPLNKATTTSITRRVEWIKEIETTATKALSLPWGKIRSLVLMELALVYFDFSKTLSELPVPKELNPEELKEYKKTVQEIVDPFTGKGNEIAGRAFQVASESAVDSTTLSLISASFPDLSKTAIEKLHQKIPTYSQFDQVQALDVLLLAKIDSTFAWSKAQDKKGHLKPISTSSNDELSVLLRNTWIEAFESKNWVKAGFVLQEMADKKLIQKPVLKTMRALTLTSVGAQSEALLELQAAAEDLDPELRNDFNLVLAYYYIHSASIDNSIRLTENIEKFKASQKQKEAASNG